MTQRRIQDFKVADFSQGIELADLTPEAVGMAVEELRAKGMPAKYLVLSPGGQRQINVSADWHNFLDPVTQVAVLKDRGLIGTTLGIEIYTDGFLDRSEWFMEKNIVMPEIT